MNSMQNKLLLALISASALSLSSAASERSGQGLDRYNTVVFSGYYETTGQFEVFAEKAKALGATHLNITVGLPWAKWKHDVPGDPYPAWLEGHATLMEMSPPEAIRKHIPEAHTGMLARELDARCAILRRLSLKAAVHNNGPEVMPESVFEANPLWRGPRVDHIPRSRTARFSMNVDNPEVLALYRESMKQLVSRYPEIELYSFLTTDSGSGFDWSGGLYPSANGNTFYKNRPFFDRVEGYVQALQDGAEDAGGAVDIRVIPISPQSWMIPSFSHYRAYAKKFDKGMAMGNFEGPDASPFIASAGRSWEWNFFFPVVGIEDPAHVIRGLAAAAKSTAPRLQLSFDYGNEELYANVFQRFWEDPATDPIAQLQLLRALAVDRVGEEHAGALLDAWLAIDEISRSASVLKIHTPLMLGCIHQRWLTRPLVPLPELLSAEETEFWDPYRFQAMDEAHRLNYADLQATQVYGGWEGKFFVEQITFDMNKTIAKARGHLGEVIGGVSGSMKAHYELLDLRLQALDCLANNVRHFSSYQGQLDRIRELEIKPEPHPVLGAQSTWDRSLLIDTARADLDNTALLIDILQDSEERILMAADSPEDERIRMLGPDLIEQLRMKLKVMNARWNDYNLLFTPPNP
jgi:hypothetical protein